MKRKPGQLEVHTKNVPDNGQTPYSRFELESLDSWGTRGRRDEKEKGGGGYKKANESKHHRRKYCPPRLTCRALLVEWKSDETKQSRCHSPTLAGISITANRRHNTETMSSSSRLELSAGGLAATKNSMPPETEMWGEETAVSSWTGRSGNMSTGREMKTGASGRERRRLRRVACWARRAGDSLSFLTANTKIDI